MTYRISTRDPGDTPDDEWTWNPRYVGLSLWGLRDAIRTIRGMGYDPVSYLVEAEPEAQS